MPDDTPKDLASYRLDQAKEFLRDKEYKGVDDRPIDPTAQQTRDSGKMAVLSDTFTPTRSPHNTLFYGRFFVLLHPFRGA